MFIAQMNPILMCKRFDRHMDELYEKYGKRFDTDGSLFLKNLEYKIKYAESFLSHKNHGKET